MLIPQLHNKCDGIEPKAVIDLLLKVRVLGKFLGYLVFLPYWSQSSGSQFRANYSSVCVCCWILNTLVISIAVQCSH